MSFRALQQGLRCQTNFTNGKNGLSEQSRNIPASSNKWQWLIPNQKLSANPLCEQNPL